MTHPSFNCSRCGACCRNVDLAAETRHLSRGDGVCRNFDDSTSRCLIYDHRPDICRIDVQYIDTYSAMMSWDHFCDLNAKCCQSLRAFEYNLVT